MSCTIVVGGQYGSEGKGKVVALTVARLAEPWVVRCGGPNSGHTVFAKGSDLILRQVPAGAGHSDAALLLGAGCVVDESLLLGELDILGLPRERVVVDPRAVLVTQEDRSSEADAFKRIASTASGTGAALARRMSRIGEVSLVASSDVLRKRVRVESVAPLLQEHMKRGGDLVVEGTQGFGLSLFHGPDYPYVTARDTTASAFASEVGISPRHVDAITMVVRTFPIRVGGNSGPLDGEISWEAVRQLSGAPEVIPEYTSVTRRLRRVGTFKMSAVVTACEYNRPTSLAVMGLDRLDFRNSGVTNASDLTISARRFLRELMEATGVPVEWVGTGFRTLEALHLHDATEEQHLRELAR